MLKLTDLHVHYGGIHALKGVSLEVPKGKIVTLIGANGAGKSSTLRAISGLIKNKKGSITYNGQDIGQKSPVEIVKTGIVMSPEGRRIFGHLTVLENLYLGAYSRDDKVGVEKDILWVFELFPRLKERQRQKSGTLSGGEQQMLAVGRALMSRPQLVMLDEPSLGLAPLLVREVFEIIRTINKQGMTVLLVEQNALCRPQGGPLRLRAGDRTGGPGRRRRDPGQRRARAQSLPGRVIVMDLAIFSMGGTIDKIYFDDLSDYVVGEPQAGIILNEARAELRFPSGRGASQGQPAPSPTATGSCCATACPEAPSG